MGAVLAEKQYELDERVVFGLDCPVALEATGWQPGSAALANQDVRLPGTDGIRFGKDTVGSATWAFNHLFTNTAREADAWEALAELASVWNDPAIRGESGRVVPLRYRIADRTMRVYGRPRRFDYTPNNLSLNGRIDIVADFGTVDDMIYEDQLQTKTIGIAPPIDLEAGFEVPFVPPFSSSPGSSIKQSSIVVGGKRPTPVVIRFDGPVANADLRIAGQRVLLVDSVTKDDPVTLDARPWVRSITKRSGGSVRVSPRVTKVSKMWLPPGPHQVIFMGEDPTATASVTISWHNALASPR